MGTFEFRLPDIGEGVAEGEVVQWFVKEGETIQEDAPLVSVLTDKANVEIPSPKAGRISKLHASVGQKVKVGGLLVTIETQGGPAAAAPASPAPAPPPARTPAAPAAPVPPPTPATGVSATPAGRSLASPYLRRLAAERGIDLATVKGSGPGGRITEADLTGASAPRAEAAAAATPRAGSPGAPTFVAAGDDIIERVPIRGVRRAISEHMSQSVHTAAHFTYVEEIDVSELVRFRERMGRHVEKDGVKLSYLPFILKAAIAGLRAHPRMNATMDDAKEELLVHGSYDIGIATAAPEGLVVPVVRAADTKSVGQLAREIQSLAERARQGKLAREELIHSSFTITSLGALGGVMATPILNYPQVAILGVHKIARRPTYQADGSIGPSDLMNLSVSLDHRILDGIVAAQFLAVVKAHLEDPHKLFAELA
ncbi:MAG TPA: dihydrolipoamide acetyltransferase family protein [Thermoplasmata archaeon]|nr:dihydrolipoamide acetyltransferase family protein [Thermoplasmata archaeon]